MDMYNYNKYSDKLMQHFNQGNHEKVLKYSERLINMGVNDPGVWNLRGIAFANLGRNEEALQCYKNSLNLDPSGHIVWQNKGDTLMLLGRFQGAIKCYEKTLEFNPTNVYALNQNGVALFNLGKFKEALKSYETALELAPYDAVVLDNKKSAQNAIENDRNNLVVITGNLICQNCGFKNLVDSKYCESCGTILEKNNKCICQNCGFENPKEAKFCSGCGSNLSNDVNNLICSNCKFENSDGSIFCQNCGNSLTDSVDISINETKTETTIDVNSCSEEEFASLPNINLIQAKKAVSLRKIHGSFKSIEDFCTLMELKPHVSNKIQELITCCTIKKPENKGSKRRIVDF